MVAIPTRHLRGVEGVGQFLFPPLSFGDVMDQSEIAENRSIRATMRHIVGLDVARFALPIGQLGLEGHPLAGQGQLGLRP